MRIVSCPARACKEQSPNEAPVDEALELALVPVIPAVEFAERHELRIQIFDLEQKTAVLRARLRAGARPRLGVDG